MITVSMLAAALATVMVGIAGAPQPTQPTHQAQRQLPRPDFSQLSPVMTPERAELDARYRQVEAVRKEKYQAEKDASRNARRAQPSATVARRLFTDN